MQKQSLSYKGIFASFKKGQRNGNWRKLRFLDKALYRAAMEYAKRGRRVVNGKLIEKLLGLAARLKETRGMRIFKFRRGFERAAEMLEKGEEKEVFVWAPRLKGWLKDPDYIFWLGMGRR